MDILVMLHSVLRWILLILLVASVFKSLNGFSNKKTLSAGDKKLWLFTMISAHTNLLIGLILLVFGRYGIVNTNLPEGTSVMKDSYYRFFQVEHPVMMVIAIVLITIARGQVKKSIPDPAKYKKAFWLFVIALIVIMAAIPWPFYGIVGQGRQYFPH
jgi:uncharacterized membrane protein